MGALEAITAVFGVLLLAGCAAGNRTGAPNGGGGDRLALSIAPGGRAFAVVEGEVRAEPVGAAAPVDSVGLPSPGLLPGTSSRPYATATRLVRWGSLAATDAATDIDATDALVVRVALREGAVAVLDRETGTVRERLTLDALRGTPDGARVPLRADLLAARTLADGSVVALLALADAVVVRWDAARQPSIWATAASLPPGAFALERDAASGGIVVLGARGALVWLDRFGAVTARADAGPDIRALGRAAGGVVVLGAGTARRVWPDGRTGAGVALGMDVSAATSAGPGVVATLGRRGRARGAVPDAAWR